MSATPQEVEDFLNGPLVTWLESCIPRPEILSGYQSLLDGMIIHSVWLQIDPEPQNNPIQLDIRDEILLSNARAKNFVAIVKNLKALYEEELGQTVLLFPDCSVLGFSPDSRVGLDQMKLLLTLLLGAAVQCPNKEIFIGRIKELDVNTQHSIVELIKQVTDNYTLVISNDTVEQLPPDRMYSHIIRIAKERDRYHSNWISSLSSSESETKSLVPPSVTSPSSTSPASDTNHMAVELVDLKSKLRKIRQELEEKSEFYIEVKEELDHKNSLLDKLRTESQEWYTESRRAAAYRDEVDVLRERAERADRLEIEVQRLREKLSDSEFFKTRVEELREDNRMLLETKDMLEEQLQRSRKRCEHAMTLETEIIKYKQKLNDMALERDADKTKLQEILDENTQLQLAKKSLNSTLEIDAPLSDEEECASGDNSLSEQLTNNAQTRALKLELENRRLQQSLDKIKESTFLESANKLLELEKEKKKLTLKVDQLQDNCQRMTQQNKEFESIFKNALEENKKLQDSIDNRQLANERQLQEREVDRMKIVDLEKHIETVTKEKQRMQNLNDSIQRRADDLERFLDSKTKEIDLLQPKIQEYEMAKNKMFEIQHKVNTLERDNVNLTKDVQKLRENIETKDVLLDKNDSQINNQLKEIQTLSAHLEEIATLNSRIQQLENTKQELLSQSKIYKETIATLQKDLIDGTLATKKVKKELEKLGIEDDELCTIGVSVESVVQKLVKNPETFKTVREIMLQVSKDTLTSADICVLCHKQEIYTVEKNIEISNSCQLALIDTNAKRLIHPSYDNHWKEQYDQLNTMHTELQTTIELLQAENARQKVDVSTLGSQITSLNTQHVALQLANSQLASEKDVLMKRVEALKQKNESILHDQVTLQCLHDQLSSEYEALCKEKESIKIASRDIRTDNRNLREREQTFLNQIDELQKQIESIRQDNENLSILRAEHSKLKQDFRNLFTSSEVFKTEYKNMQKQYKNARQENSQLKLEKTELTGQINALTDHANSLELEISKLNQKCELLLQMNVNIDDDRRKLMDHVSQLLAQYHNLLVYSLDDKQHYHDEEKLFADKVNSLYRQKEKLEEKIITQYGKMESCSPKKKTFGASFVKRVKKASSDLINKVPSRNRRSWSDNSRLTQSHSVLESESGGNESDNSCEEPSTMTTASLPACDTNTLQRNTQFRQSLQRNNTPVILRGGVRSSFQTLKRDDAATIRGNRNSVHGLDSPDVTGSSLTLGAAGSRRTVYLIDDMSTKLPDSTASSSNNTSTATTDTASLDTATLGGSGGVGANASGISNNNISNNANNNNNSSTDTNNQSTLLMYNRISNVFGSSGGVGVGSSSGNGSSPSEHIQKNGFATNVTDGNKGIKDKKRESIWYEYGCV